MGRYVLSAPLRLRSSKALEASTAWELWLSRLQFLVSVSFLLGCISLTSLAPYIMRHQWIFFAAAGAVYAALGVRDLCVLLQRPENSEARDKRRPSAASPISADVCAVFLMIFGSLLLLNAALLARFREDLPGASRWQFVGSFWTYLVGYACNSMSYHEDMIDVVETRNVVVFQMSMASVLNLIGALLNSPLVDAEESQGQRALVRAWLHGIAGILSFTATMVNHFHVRAFMLNEELLFAELKHLENMERLAKLAQEDALKRQPTLLERIFIAVRNRLVRTELNSSAKGGSGEIECHALTSESIMKSSSFEPDPGYETDETDEYYDDGSNEEALYFSHVAGNADTGSEALMPSVVDDREYYKSSSESLAASKASRRRKEKRPRRERESVREDSASKITGVSGKRRHRSRDDGRRSPRLGTADGDAGRGHQDHAIYGIDWESEEDSPRTHHRERRRAYGHR